MQWKKIEELPEEYKNSHKMFVVIGIDVCPVSPGHKYTTDPVCVWYDKHKEFNFERWDWHFPPTHFCELPKYN